MEIFESAANNLRRIDNYKVWQDGNHPIALDSNSMSEQKLEYLHNNPVAAGIVYNQEDYVYSSAVDYVGSKGLLNIETID